MAEVRGIEKASKADGVKIADLGLCVKKVSEAEALWRIVKDKGAIEISRRSQ
jgi:hypothetical protein